jgi:hypothetical protein
MTRAGSPDPGNVPVMTGPLSISIPSCGSCTTVGPGPDPVADRVVIAGRGADRLPAGRHQSCSPIPTLM